MDACCAAVVAGAHRHGGVVLVVVGILITEQPDSPVSDW